jgi:hypothetical protein
MAPVVLAGGSTTVASFDKNADEYPHGLAAGPDGALYVGMGPSGEIHRVSGNGQNTRFTVLPSGTLNDLAIDLGIDSGGRTDPGGRYLYAALASGDSSTHGIWRTNLTTVASERFVAMGTGTTPNGLAFRGSDLFVTDSEQGRILRITPARQMQVWASSTLLRGRTHSDGDVPLGAKGMAFTRGLPMGSFTLNAGMQEQEYLYVTNFDYGRIVRIPVQTDGSAGQPEIFFQDARLLAGAHSIRFDGGPNGGTAVVTSNLTHRVVAISPAPYPGAQTIVEGGALEYPTGMVNMEGRLYVNSGGPHEALTAEETGDLHPALLRLTDLPLPLR